MACRKTKTQSGWNLARGKSSRGVTDCGLGIRDYELRLTDCRSQIIIDGLWFVGICINGVSQQKLEMPRFSGECQSAEE